MKTNLQAMRKAAGFKSAAAFAKHLGISTATYTDHEQGRRSFTLAQAWDYADALGCTIDEIAGRKPPEEPKTRFAVVNLETGEINEVDADDLP